MVGYLLGFATGMTIAMTRGPSGMKKLLGNAIDREALLITNMDGKPLTADEAVEIVKNCQRTKRTKTE